MRITSYLLLIIIFLVPVYATAQEATQSKEVDSLYREDQIFIGITYNLLANRPQGVNNRSFSGGFHLGFLRDMPLNIRRNVAVAAGLGYAFDAYGQNLFVGKGESGVSSFIVLDDSYTFDKNRFVTHKIELPVELRWRTSTPEDYRFWRIYGGVKLGYIFHFKSTFVQENNKLTQSNIEELNRLRYTAFLNFGYNTFNFQIQYSLNTFFDENARVEGIPVELTAIKLGLIFYIL